MKILYVEDDLAANIPRILNLFGPLLPKTVRDRLTQSENDPTGYGASNMEVKAWLAESRIVDAVYEFQDALVTIRDHWSDYKLFILDRNLTDGHGEWDPDDVCQAYGTEDQEMLLEFITREGDFLVHLLHPKLNESLPEKVFFLTANTSESELRSSSPDFRAAIHRAGFGTDNFIQKANEDDCLRLAGIIENCDALRVKAENLDLVKAVLLAAPACENDVLELFKHGVRAPSPRRASLMRNMRSAAEACANALRERLCPVPYRTERRLDDVFARRQPGGAPICNRDGYPECDNRAIMSCFMTIQTVCSERAVHADGNSKIDGDLYLAVYHAFRTILAWTGEKLGSATGPEV